MEKAEELLRYDETIIKKARMNKLLEKKLER